MLKWLLLNIMIAAVVSDPASDQLPDYKKKHPRPIGILTNSNGAPVEIKDTRALFSPLLTNDFFIENMVHLNRERIPERNAQAKGAGAFGYFVVTHNISDICKAKLFSQNGKKTSVFVRFSQTSSDKGEPDTVRDSRGFAVKFYSEEGNFDLVCVNTPMFIIKEPFLMQLVYRIIKRNPVTNLRDPNMFWDFVNLRPECMNYVLYFFGVNGIPDGYRYMPGYSIHTYQVYNKCGKSNFIRFHWTPDMGVRNLNAEEALNIASMDREYAIRDLYNAIANGDFPSWTLSVQVLDAEDIENCDFDPFDVTKVLPEDKYPLRPVGKLILDQNPTNYFAYVEQAAFSPCNLVSGILGAPDKVFEARRLSYGDAQRYRLGVNYDKILVNCPHSKVLSYDRDGVSPVGFNGGDAPNYFPNSYHGPIPYIDKNRPTLITIDQYDDSYNFEQPTEMYNNLSNEERTTLVANIVGSLSQATACLQKGIIDLFKLVHRDLAYRTAVALAGNGN